MRTNTALLRKLVRSNDFIRLHETKQKSQAFSGSAAGRWQKLDHGRRGTGIRGRELIMCHERQAEREHGPLVPVGQAKQGVQGFKHRVLTGITAVSLAAGVPKMAQAGSSGVMTALAADASPDAKVQEQTKPPAGKGNLVVAAAAGAGVLGTSGLVLMRFAVSNSNASVSLAAVGEMLQPRVENATVIVAEMKPLLDAWEKALVAVDDAQVALEKEDPARSGSGLLSLWYAVDPLNTRSKALLPLQAALNASLQLRDQEEERLTAFMAKVKSDDIRKDCQGEKSKVVSKVEARNKALEAARLAAEEARIAAEKARRRKEREEQREKERAEAAVRRAEAERQRKEEETMSEKAAEDRVRRAVMADLERKADSLIKDKKMAGTQTLKLDALLAAKKQNQDESKQQSEADEKNVGQSAGDDTRQRLGSAGKIGLRPDTALTGAEPAARETQAEPAAAPADSCVAPPPPSKTLAPARDTRDAPKRVAVEFDPYGEGSKLLKTVDFDPVGEGLKLLKTLGIQGNQEAPPPPPSPRAGGQDSTGGQEGGVDALTKGLSQGSKYLSAFSMPWSPKPAKEEEANDTSGQPEIPRRLGSFRAAGELARAPPPPPPPPGQAARPRKERPGVIRKPGQGRPRQE